MATIPTAPAQVGNGRALHYVRKDEFHSKTIGCGRLVANELTEKEAAGRKECDPCKRAVEALAPAQPAETEAPAADVSEQAPAVTEEEARRAVKRVHADACGFQPLMPEDGGDRPIGWTFRTYVGAGLSRYGVVTAAGQIAPVGLYEYVTTAERAFRQHQQEPAPAPVDERTAAQDALLAVPFHGPDGHDGPRGLCGYDDHTAPLLPSGRLAEHERRQGVMGACPGSCRPARGSREELTMRDTTAITYNPPRRRCLASLAKEGDVVVVDGQPMEVQGVQVGKTTSSYVWLTLDGVSTGPRLFTLEDRLEYRRRIRRDDVPCKVCGVYVVMEVDEAVDGVPNVRLCGLCDRQQPDELTEDQARARVERTYPHAHAFKAERTERGRLTGYTFQVGRLHSARYGWITPAGTYAQGLEDYRSQAAAMLPMAARDEQAARA